MATARLRKTFRYPTDNSDEDIPAGIDEEEQKKLIDRLKKEDEDRNELYKRILLVLPLIAAMSFIPTLMTSSVYQVRLASFLSVTSLVTTAYTLCFVPTTRSPNESKQTLLGQSEYGPLKRYIEPANGLLSVLLGFNAAIYKHRLGVPEEFWLLSLLPVVSFFVIAMARRVMVEVDIGELEKLKYGYKGA